MNLEKVILAAVPHGEPIFAKLVRQDGREATLIVSIEHERVYVMRREVPYAGANHEVWAVYRWRDNAGDWVAHRVPGTAAYDLFQQLAAGDPLIVNLDW